MSAQITQKVGKTKEKAHTEWTSCKATTLIHLIFHRFAMLQYKFTSILLLLLTEKKLTLKFSSYTSTKQWLAAWQPFSKCTYHIRTSIMVALYKVSVLLPASKSVQQPIVASPSTTIVTNISYKDIVASTAIIIMSREQTSWHSS